MAWKGPEYDGDFPSLGWLLADWIEAHCVIPDGFHKGDPFILGDGQLRFSVQHYGLHTNIEYKPERPLLASAFLHRRSQLVRAQKWGKNPFIASLICGEGVGPVLFAGWAQGGESWDCRDHGCDCGWSYQYEVGEPMAMSWPTPLIQVTAVSEDQTDNTWGALLPMINNGPLSEMIPKTGEEFIRLPGGGRIDAVTSAANSRLGQRVTFAPQDETGLWLKSNRMFKTADTQRRGLAGMGGRSIETTNSWDPNEHSVAQRTFESKKKDIYRDFPQPPAHLNYLLKRDRRKIHQFNYSEAPWVNIDDIENEASEILETDPAQAERFFGNRVVASADAAFDIDRWKALGRPDIRIPQKSLITIGMDGARFDDAVAMIATDVKTGFQWPLEVPDMTDTVSIWTRPEWADDDYEHPADQIKATMAMAMAKYEVWRAYIDPQYIDHLVDDWAGEWNQGEQKTWKIIKWLTNRKKQMAEELRSYRAAMSAGDVTHNGDPIFHEHIANARRKKQPGLYDEKRRPLWTLAKPSSGGKIDAAMAGCLSWIARGDAIAAGATQRKQPARPRRVR